MQPLYGRSIVPMYIRLTGPAAGGENCMAYIIAVKRARRTRGATAKPLLHDRKSRLGFTAELCEA